MTINQFYESMLLSMEPFRTEWQGQSDNVVVLKLWNADLDWANRRVCCLLPPVEKPTGSAGGLWERRKLALDTIRAGTKHGFFTIGNEVDGKQRGYVGFREDKLWRVREIRGNSDGSLWVHFDDEMVTPEQVKKISSGSS